MVMLGEGGEACVWVVAGELKSEQGWIDGKEQQPLHLSPSASAVEQLTLTWIKYRAPAEFQLARPPIIDSHFRSISVLIKMVHQNFNRVTSK
jgi:hypothetical protein